VRERPILFSAPLVRALLAGTKSITRRPCKVQPEPWKAHHLEGGCQRGDWKPAEMADGTWDLVSTFAASQVPGFGRCPYGALGERLWVRETLRRVDSGGRGERWVYGADETTVTLPREDPRVPEMISWAHHKEGDVCTSIHMPRWASRILLEVTDVRVERVTDITEDDAYNEGVLAHDGEFDDVALCARAKAMGLPAEDGRVAFAEAWTRIYGEESLTRGDWVWRIAFRRVEVPRG